MKIICPDEKSLCLPLKIIPSTDSLNNGKLGGRPPKGVSPKKNSIPLKYFVTLKFSEKENLFASIFVADFEKLLSLRGKLNRLSLVDIVIHHPQQRDDNSEFQSQISEHDIEVLETVTDFQIIDGDVIFRSGHKIGGYPHLIRNKNNLAEDINNLFKSNFLQIVQIDFPGIEDDTVSGNWFFGDGIFCLFGKDPFEKENWFWYWDM